jgi:hypothetical protein
MVSTSGATGSRVTIPRIAATHIFPNCPRYQALMQQIESRFEKL